MPLITESTPGMCHINYPYTFQKFGGQAIKTSVSLSKVLPFCPKVSKHLHAFFMIILSTFGLG